MIFNLFKKDQSIQRTRNKNLWLLELIAIALWWMVWGWIFTILGISVSMIGNLTPFAIIIWGIIASLAAYSYVKLWVYYKDEWATYSFYKRTYKNSHYSASAIWWFIIFWYISTLALYAYTFSAYSISATDFANNIFIRKLIAITVIWIFTLINILSVKWMWKLEDLMVYTKLVVLLIISIVLIKNGNTDFTTFSNNLFIDFQNSSIMSILIVASITFVSYEWFQLVINAVNEMEKPEKNIPRAIYSAIFLTILIYVIISLWALFAIPMDEIINNKEYALASWAWKILWSLGSNLVIIWAILATSSAISWTIFGSSRQMSIIAKDWYFPKLLSKRSKYNIPRNSLITIASVASILILIGWLELILEFWSITFLLVSLLMAIANFKIRDKTNSSTFFTILSIIWLLVWCLLIFYFEFINKWQELTFILLLYFLLTLWSFFYSRKNIIKQ